MDKHNVIGKMNEVIKEQEELGRIVPIAFAYLFLPTAWFSSAVKKVEDKWGFIQKIMNLFIVRKLSTMSGAVLLVDDELKSGVENVFKEHGLNFYLFYNDLNVDSKNKIFFDEKLANDYFDKGSTLHSHVIVNVGMLWITNASDVHIDGNSELINYMKKYGYGMSDEDLLSFASLIRAALMAASISQSEKGGYPLFEILIIDGYNSSLLVESAKKTLPLTNDYEITENILTGNGFSKYLTKDNGWLSKKLSILDLVIGAKKVSDDVLEKAGSLYQLNEVESDRFKKLDIDAFENWQETIIKYLSWFTSMQVEFFKHFSDITSINDSNFYKWLEKILPEGNQFKHKERNYLFHFLYTVTAFDIFSNVEVLFMIFDKFSNGSGYPKNLAGNLVMYGGQYYVEQIWNGGLAKFYQHDKIAKEKFKNVFTMNYDLFTDQLFGETHHLHGSFNLNYNVERLPEIRVKSELGAKPGLNDKLFYEWLHPNYTSIVLKGGDYKMGHIHRVMNTIGADNNFLALKKLSNTDGSFSVVGTLILGDPHVLDLLAKNNRIVYITYYYDSELPSIQRLIQLSKILGRVWRPRIIKFDKVINSILK